MSIKMQQPNGEWWPVRDEAETARLAKEFKRKSDVSRAATERYKRDPSIANGEVMIEAAMDEIAVLGTLRAQAVRPRYPRSDWQMPEPPVEGAYPVAHYTGEGWWLGWQHDDFEKNGTLEDKQIPWPFEDNRATSDSELGEIGFRVV